MLFVGHKVD